MDLPRNFTKRSPEPEPLAPLSGTRSEMMQRLQVGVFGLAAMLLMIGLADVVLNRLKESEATTVAEPATMDDGAAAPAQPSDPLAEAGVMPELPAGPDVQQGTQQPPAQPKPGAEQTEPNNRGNSPTLQ